MNLISRIFSVMRYSMMLILWFIAIYEQLNLII